MPILGSLSEFPLPEVLLLIGMRTGRLRLLDVPEFGVMDVDFSNGEVQTMRMGADSFTDADAMIEKLSAVVQAQGGMFEFRLLPVASVQRHHPLMVNQLVMSLVCHVDEQMARKRTLASSSQRYALTIPQPEIWIEPELHGFFIGAHPLLAMGCHLEDLAQRLGLDAATVHVNLTNLRLLGLIQLVETKPETVPLAEFNVQEQISRKSNEFLRASRAAGEIKRITDRMPKIKK